MWGTWLTAALATFGVLEYRALRNPVHGHTLTATTRRWLGIHPVRPWRYLGDLVLIGAPAWFVLHILHQAQLQDADEV